MIGFEVFFIFSCVAIGLSVCMLILRYHRTPQFRRRAYRWLAVVAVVAVGWWVVRGWGPGPVWLYNVWQQFVLYWPQEPPWRRWGARLKVRVVSVVKAAKRKLTPPKRAPKRKPIRKPVPA